MAGILIDQIQLSNYRQYDSFTLNFSHQKNHELFVIIASNGTGKTTLLNSITWCLYGTEKLSDEKETKLPLVNTKILLNANEGDIIPVSVKMRIIDGNKYVIFTRQQSFKIVKDSKGMNSCIGNSPMITVQTTEFSSKSNTKTIEGVDAELAIKQYFDEDIFDFYFFDGENLKTYFDKKRSEKIRNAIYNISQVTLLENTIKHLEIMIKEATNKIGKDAPDVNELVIAQEAIQKRIDTANESLSYYTSKKSSYLEEIATITERQREIRPIQERIEERDKLEKEEDELDALKLKNQESFSDFIRKYTILLNLYPSAKHMLAIINDKEEKHELPPNIDKQLLERLLKDPDAKCPICDNDVNETAREHILKLLDNLSISVSTGIALSEVKGALENMIEEAEKYKDEKSHILDERDDIKTRYEKIDTDLRRISKQVALYDTEPNKTSDNNLEQRRLNLETKRDEAVESIGFFKNQLKTEKENYDAYTVKIEEATKAQEKSKKIIDERETLLKLQAAFKTVKNNITGNMRSEIERITYNNFMDMSRKHNTFGKITIDDNYNVEIADMNEYSMLGSLSATEKMSLAYAFTLAIHSASGKNCPLVIDSPLGRVSDVSRDNMASALLDTSIRKQIIMLFTPDEYSESVRNIYRGKVTECNLALSSDEKHVESEAV